MKVETQNVSPCRVKVIVDLDADEVRGDYNEVVNIFMKRGSVRGFRAGHVPRAIIVKSFDGQIKEEVSNRIFRKFSSKAIEDQNLKPYALLNIEDFDLKPETGAKFTFQLDIHPSVELPAYKQIPVTFLDQKPTDEDVTHYIDNFRKRCATFDEVSDDQYLIAENDMVDIDFEGTIEGKPIEELSPEAKPISSRKGFWATAGEDGGAFPEIQSALRGLRLGEKSEVKFQFPSDYPLPAVAGKPAVYQVTVNKIRKSILPTDEEFLKRVQAPDMETLRADIMKDVSESMAAQEKSRRENMVLSELLKRAGEFDLPETEVAREIEITLDQMQQQAQRQNLSREDLEAHREEIIKQATEVSKNKLRVRYLVSEIAQAEKIEASKEDVDALIEKMAHELGKTVDQTRALLEKNQRMGYVSAQVIHDKVVQFLLDNAEKSDMSDVQV